MSTLAWNERRDRGYGSSFALAFAMHAILLAALFFGVRFQNFAPETVSVELWEPPPAAPKLEPKPEPKPEPAKPKAPPRDERAEKLMREQLAAESAATSERLARELAAREAAARELSAREKALAAWVSAIRNKIRGRILEPVVAQVPGNPEAVYQVTLLPTGEVLNARLVKSSGNPAYDQELQRAIQASSPLPKPDPQSLFQRTLELRFRPKDP